MKKTFLLTLTLLLLAPLSSFAFQSQAGETLSITTPIQEDFYAAGGTINVNTPAAQDLTIVGGKNFVNSAVSQDLIVVGGDDIINGSVGESAYIVGGTININSTITKDLLVGGGNVFVGTNTRVQGDTVIAAGSIDLDGTVRDAHLMADQLTLHGTIQGDATIQATQIQIVTGARILGNLNYKSAKQNIGLENIVAGQVTFKQIQVQKGMRIFGGILGGFLTLGFFFLLAFGILFFYIGRNRRTKSIKQLQDKPWSSLGYGVLLYAVIPVAILLLLVTVIGIPFGLLLLAAYIFMFAFYKLFNVIFYSHLLIDKRGGTKKVKLRKQIGIILVCVIISSLVATIDIILAFFALGAVIQTYRIKKK